MRRKHKAAQYQHTGRRVTAGALAVLMAAGCLRLGPLQFQAQAAESKAYEIYPNPHVMTYSGEDYIVRKDINVVLETGIDRYTKDRLEEVLALKDITYTTSNAVVEGKTNILVGIEGSGEYVDTYSDQITVTTNGLFDKLDSYVLDNDNGVITVVGKDTDAAFYGLTTLYHVFNQMDSYTIQEFHVEDWADVASRGFIEGYYGNPWSTEDRANLMTWGGYYKLNSYFYAPKDDPKHNAQWRELYTQEELETKIKPLAEAGNASKCQFVFALHPFMSNPINASNYDESVATLKAKFEQTMQYGVRQIAVLADDAGVPGGDNETGWSLQTRLMTELVEWVSSKEMQEKYPGLKITIPFCPNAYMYGGNSAQLQYLGKNMPESVPLVVTGGKVWGEVSQSFTTSFTQGVGRGPYMWINWPCTDNSKQHLIMGGYTTFLQVGVDPANIQGIVLNPMQQSEPSKVAIFGNACYSWNIWDSQEEADQAWNDSFKYVDHNSAMETEASTALRELSKHMINQNMDSRVTVLQESVDLKPILNDFKEKLSAGTITAADVDVAMAEFVKLQDAAQTYRAKAGDQNLKNQIVYWLDCWDDTTEAAIAYLNGVKAVLVNDSTNIIKYNIQGKTAFDSSKTHGFNYVGTTQYAEVGVQHIVPFIKTLATYVSQYAELAMDPSKVIATFITNRTDNPVNGTEKALDGDDTTFVSYQNPVWIKQGDYVGVAYNKVINIENIRFLLGNGKNHFEASKLQYTLDGESWQDITLTGMQNAFTGVRDQYLEVVVKQENLPKDFQAMGIRLTATANNTLDAYLNVHEIQINKAESGESGVVEGTYSTNQTRRNNTSFDVLKDGNNGNASANEVWVSDSSNGLPVDAYIEYRFSKPVTINRVSFAQGGSAAGDVINKGSIQYLDDEGNWQTVAAVNSDKVQTFELSNENIVTAAVRVKNDEYKKIWWRVGEFNVEFTDGATDKPIEYNVIRTDIWKVEGGSEANLFDGNDSTYVYYDPDGNGNPNNINGDDFMVDQFLGYDLGKVAELDSIHLVVGNSAKPSDKIVKYAIETSMDNRVWTAVPGYESYTGKTNAVDTLNIELSQPIQARYIRVRNLEQRGAWGYFSEFTVTEVVHQTGSTENLYTNITTDILSNATQGQVSLTNGSVTLGNGDYIGVDLGNIKSVTNVATSQLPGNVALETSRNGVTWTAYNGDADTDARYVRAVSSTDSVELNLTQFEVTFQYVAEKSVESDFGIEGDNDMRTANTVGNVFDGDLSTLGMITGKQEEGKHITFDLGQTIHFESLRYYIVETQLNYPRHVKFEVSADGQKWTEVLIIGDGDFSNAWDSTVAKDMQDKTLTHDSQNPGYMYAEADSLNVDGRYIRVTPLSTYSHRWLGFSEIQINGGAYISPEANRDIVSDVVEEPGKVPSNALDGDYSTTYKPGQANGSFTYYISEPENLATLRMIQLGAVSNATVTANFIDGARSAVTLGKLNQAINEFALPQNKTLESITVTWGENIPEIAEIVTSTTAAQTADKAELKAELDKTQATDTWIADSVTAYEEAKNVAQSVYDNPYATQTVVDSALGALKSAAANAVLKATNLPELQKLVDEMVNNDQHIYTVVTYYGYSSAVENLKAALEGADNLSQTKADQLKVAVEEAQKALEYSTYNQEVAQMTAEGYAALVSGNYSKSTFDAVTAAKNAIDTLLNKADATPQEFIQAVADYQAALAALADVTLLKAEIAKAGQVNGDLYTAESYKAYMDAITAGEALLETGTKEQVEQAVANIRAMFNALQLDPGTNLDAVVAEAEALNGGNYTADSYNALMVLVAEAKANPTDGTYIQKIMDAIKALVNVEALKAQQAAAQGVNGEKYTTSSYQTLTNLMGQVDALLQSGTQQQVDQMTAQLDMAIRSLVARATGVEDYRNGITLLPADGYTPESYQAYKDAYDALMAADPANLSASEFAQLKANFEQAKVDLKRVEADNAGNNGNVQTGDSFQLMPYVLAVAVCAAGLGALVMVKSKKKG